MTAADARAVTAAGGEHPDDEDGDQPDLRHLRFAPIVDGRMAEVREVPFDQGENDRYDGVQAAAFARSATQQQAEAARAG